MSDDLLTIAAVAEHMAANILKTEIPDVPAETRAAISGTFTGFAVLLRHLALGTITVDDLEVLEGKMVDAINTRLTTQQHDQPDA